MATAKPEYETLTVEDGQHEKTFILREVTRALSQQSLSSAVKQANFEGNTEITSQTQFFLDKYTDKIIDELDIMENNITRNLKKIFKETQTSLQAYCVRGLLIIGFLMCFALIFFQEYTYKNEIEANQQQLLLSLSKTTKCPKVIYVTPATAATTTA